MNNLQGSEDWFSARIGKITSSRVSDVMAKGRGNEPSASRKNYMAQLLCERLTGQREETYTNAIMQRGIDLEPLAKSAYEIETGLLVQDVGFIVHPQLDYTGTSPDCLVFGNGVGEVKCPNSATHIATLQSGKADPKYHWQQQHQMWCTGRDWNDFISFDDRLPEGLQLFICRVPRNEKDIEQMADAITLFNSELVALENTMKTLMTKRKSA